MLLLSGLAGRNEIYFYVEKYNKDQKYVLIDFVDSNEFFVFNNITALNYNWENRPTMVEILNYSQKKLQEGVTYRVSSSTIIQLIQKIQIVEDSLIIGFRVELSVNHIEILGKAKSFNQIERFERNMDDTNNSNLPEIALNFKPIDRVIVRKIGQGNWNELMTKNKFEIVFDFGTIYTTKRRDLLQLIGNRDKEYQNSKPLFILSHWDVDHYHFLLGFDDNTIRSIPHFICRAAIPNLTARKALGKFRILNRGALIPIAPVSPYPKKSSVALKSFDMTGKGDILFHNAFKNRSRNKSGLGLTIRKKKTCVILSGDYDYIQISDHILPKLNYKCDHFLVVPHHGGKAGKFVYVNSTLNLLKEAVISVGSNPYQPPHPHGNNINELRAKGFSVIRTDSLPNDHYINI